MSRPTITLLLVEDHDEYRRLITDVLVYDRNHAYIILAATSLEEAVTTFAAHPEIACVLVDYALPDGTGVEVVQRLHELVDTAAGPAFIMLTSEDDPRLIVQALALGAHNYLVKGNTSPDEIYEAIEQALGKVAAQRELHAHRAELDNYRRALEERTQQLEREIEERKQIEEQLRQKAADLLQQNQELDAFAHTVAHDLKTPIGVVIGFADVLRETYDDLPPTKVKELLFMIAKRGREASNIVDELLLLASVRKEEVVLAPLDMEEIFIEVLERLEELIVASGVVITLPDEWPRALGYGPWIVEVWVNYMSNAIKYGGTVVRVGADARPDGTVCFGVEDNGSGLTVEEQERLFIPFTRLGQVHTEGYGLGLSIVQRIMEKIGGRVGVVSAFGKGSTFYFILPAAPVA